MAKRRNAARWVGVYTLMTAILGAVCCGGMLLSGRGPIWNVDGLMQHYPFMKIIGDWVRDALGGSFHAFDFSLGFGSDVLTSLNYYGLGDPLLMVIAAIAGASEWGIAVLVAVRVWLSGLACMALAKRQGFSGRSCAFAGAVYALSAGMLSGAATRQILFLNAYIHFPLMLAGLEDVFENRRAGLLTLASWLAALSGFYMLYCESLLLLIYAVIRYFTLKERKLSFLAAAGRALGCYALGIALAAVVFVPATLGFLDGQRLSSAANGGSVRFIYALKEYLSLPLALMTAHGLSAVQPVLIAGLVGLIPMLLNRGAIVFKGDDGPTVVRSGKSARALAIAGVVMALTPLTGWALNGFSYETTRWSFALSLLAALLGVRGIEFARMLPKREIDRVCALLASYPAALLLASVSGVKRIAALLLIGGSMIIPTVYALRRPELSLPQKQRAMLLQLAVLLFLGWTVAEGGVRRMICVVLLALIALAWLALRMRGRLGAIALIGVCALQIALNGWDVWADRADEMMRFGESETAYEQSAFSSLSEFPRTDASLLQVAPLLNAPAWSGAAGTSVYNSTISGRVFRFMQDVGNAGLIQINSICGLDGRAALETVWAVGRYAGESAPYGFARAESGIYENQYALPIGYAQTNSISTAAYEALSPLEKQWALLQCAVLDDSTGTEMAQSLMEIPIEKTEWENISREGARIYADENARITLTFAAPADCELYLSIDSLAYYGGEIALGNYLTFRSGAGERTIHLMPADFELTLQNREQFYVHLGYDSEARATAEITFARAGEYEMGEMKLYAQPMAEYPEMVSALQARGLTDVQVENDCVSGKIALSEPGTVVYAIPYSSGWTARVDGETVQTTHSAGALLAVPVEAGEHEIVVSYSTPGLRLGGAITVLAAIAAVGLLKRRK